MRKISEAVGKYMAVIVLAASALALFFPGTGLWVELSWVNKLLMLVMFGMGLTLEGRDFLPLLKQPKGMLIGCAAQYAVMPLLAFALGRLFSLDGALMTGVILVGCCPGGTASNVMTYLSGGDVAYSVAMTSVNTLLSPFLTPALCWLFLRTVVRVDLPGMFLTILQLVLIPLGAGFLLRHFFSGTVKKVSELLPLVSVSSITLIAVSVVSHNAGRILSSGLLVAGVVVLHNLLGYAAGMGLGCLLGFPLAQKKALSIEIGMQNSGLAVTLAAVSFASLPMAAVPGAVFSVWHNISGAVYANLLRNLKEEKAQDGRGGWA